MNEEYSIRTALIKLHTVPGNLRALVVACLIMGLSQMCGFNTLMYYSATLFKMVGFSNSIAVGIVVGATNFVFSCIAVKYIDRIGRRRMLVGTVWGMSAALAVAAIAFHWIPLDRETLALTTDTLGWPEIVMLVSLILFVACFGAGVAPVSWQANELLPMEVRAVGTMLIVCTCWGTNIIVASTFLSMMKSITPSGTFGFYSALCFIGWVLSIFMYPEYVITYLCLFENAVADVDLGWHRCPLRKLELSFKMDSVSNMPGSGKRTTSDFLRTGALLEKKHQNGLMCNIICVPKAREDRSGIQVHVDPEISVRVDILAIYIKLFVPCVMRSQQ